MTQVRATVCRSTRRYVDVYTDDTNLLRGKIAEGVEPLCVGDFVLLSSILPDACIVSACLPRENLLQRSSAVRRKILAANIDHLLIVTAPGAICKPQTIDRVLIAAAVEGIPTSIVWNKSDLVEEFAQSKEVRVAYETAGFQVFSSSAISTTGVTELRAFITQPDFRHVVLTGVSGVGKSSLLNSLSDAAEARTQQVSDRSGYGRQTTSEAFGYLLPRRESLPLMLCDLPGVQQFGLAHLEEAQIRTGFPEFTPFTNECRFANCSHIEEPDCGVLAALAARQINQLRYQSYSQIVAEHRLNYY